MQAIKNYDVLFVSAIGIYPCHLLSAKQHNIPVIGSVPFRSHMAADNSIGNLRMLSTHPAEACKKNFKMNFFERVLNILDAIKLKIIFLIAEAKVEAIYKTYPDQNLDLPDPKMSLIFFNNHDSIFPRAKVPNAINIGGIHVKSATVDPLPEVSAHF